MTCPRTPESTFTAADWQLLALAEAIAEEAEDALVLSAQGYAQAKADLLRHWPGPVRRDVHDA